LGELNSAQTRSRLELATSQTDVAIQEAGQGGYMTTAFVLSGAGNRGPLEVGALSALLENGIKPDFIVGTSAGAINALYLAAHGVDDPSLAKQMASLWVQANAESIYPGNLVSVAWRFATRSDSLYSSDGIRRLIVSALPPGVTTFGQLKIPLYTTASDLISSRLFLFGDDPSAPLVVAALASASVPVVHPPVLYNELQLVDGGVVANLPASIAMNKGATEIYAINASYGGTKAVRADGVLDVVGHIVNTFIAQNFWVDMARAEADPSVNLHHIHVEAFRELSFRDFSKTQEMVRYGRQKAAEYLAAPAPRGLEPASARQPLFVGGAHEIFPPYQSSAQTS
jgi:NTE family protein